MIKAEIVADSLNEFGNRLTTMVVTFPRYILAELNTHRMFSRNSASSRAIPFEKMVKSVKENPFIPIAWMKDHKGMQGTEYFTGTCSEEWGELDRAFHYEEHRDVPAADYFLKKWLEARDEAVANAEMFSELGLTKQIVNRQLEAFMWHTVIITASEWENFFALRCPRYTFTVDHGGGEYGGRVFRSMKDWTNHWLNYEEKDGAVKPNHPGERIKDRLNWMKINSGQADIHMMALAEAMYDAYQAGKPKQLKAGDWHIPFGGRIDDEALMDYIMFSTSGGERAKDDLVETKRKAEIKIATARCARVSYTVVGEEDKPDNYEADIKLHDRLAASGHWSPFEHIGRAMTEKEHAESVCGKVEGYFDFDGMDPVCPTIYSDAQGWSGNLRGFIQYRKTFANENITKAVL